VEQLWVQDQLRATLLAILAAALLALPAGAVAQTPTDDVYSHAESRQQTAPADAKSAGLAFTGLDVGFVVLAGAFLVGTGLLIRRASRDT
jgi:hypothetical protein